MLHDMMKSINCCLGIVFIIGSALSSNLRLPHVIVPPHKLYNETAQLECPFDLGRHKLYAVKWYKDNEEFFRYVPKYTPPIRIYNVSGLHVIQQLSDQKRVTLDLLDLRATGIYRCEVSAEGPHFASATGEGYMTVVYLPEQGPQISGKTQEEYEVGDRLELNCTSSKSFPPASMTWYINDSPIEHGVVTSPSRNSVVFRSHTRPTSSRSSLNITLEPRHFPDDGIAKVRCLASISTLFWQDEDEKTVGNSRRYTPDSRFPEKVSSAFRHDFEASLLVRASGTIMQCWTILFTTFISLLVTLVNFRS